MAEFSTLATKSVKRFIVIGRAVQISARNPPLAIGRFGSKRAAETATQRRHKQENNFQ
jgi:hypothetical protein